MHVFGKELTIQEAAAAAKSRKSKDVFDKIVILVPHGEASSVTEDEARSTYGYKVEGDIALSQKVRRLNLVICLLVMIYTGDTSIPFYLFSHIP